MRKIILVTGNENKLREARQILTDCDVISQKIELPEIQGTRHEIASEKARVACKAIDMPIVVEDSSLCFKALDELPGPYIKDFFTTLGPQRVVKLLDGFPDKSAKAVVTLGYCEPGKEPVIIEGTINGKIVPPRGVSGFGWDVIFQPEGYDKTFAEMDPQEKNKISHRMKAFRKLKKYLADKSR